MPAIKVNKQQEGCEILEKEKVPLIFICFVDSVSMTALIILLFLFGKNGLRAIHPGRGQQILI